jgi:hypothetical protein
MGRLSSSVAKFSKQKLIPAIVIDVLGPVCSVRLSGSGKQINRLRYVGPVPTLGQGVQVNYQTGTPYVQTQSTAEASSTSVSQPTITVKAKPPTEGGIGTISSHHNDLLTIQGGLPATLEADAEYYHLTEYQHDHLGAEDSGGSPGGGGGHEIQDGDSTPLPQEPALRFEGDMEVSDDPAGNATVVSIVATNHMFVDMYGGGTGGGSTYGVLTVEEYDDTIFTVEQLAYTPGLLNVYMNGQLLPQGDEGWHELDPAAGTFQFEVAPDPTDIIIAVYGFTAVHAGPPGPIGPEGPSYACTSSSSLSIAEASKTFVTQEGLAYNEASRIKAVSSADPTNFMEGNITSYSGTSLVVAVDYIGGSGTHSDWIISLIGNIKPSVHHQQIIWEIRGASMATSDQGVDLLKIPLAYVGAGATIEEIYIILGTSPTGSNLRFRILKNGSTIFTVTDYVELGVGSTIASRTTDFASGGVCTKDDYFQLELVQGDSNVIAANATIQMRYKWTLTGA